MPSNMTSFFDELVEAKRAVEALPTVQAALDKAESEKRFLQDSLAKHGEVIDNHLSTITDLKTRISHLEASLDSANKSKGDVDDKLRLLTSILHSVAADASEAVALVEPKPAVVSVQSDPTQQVTTGVESNASVADGTSTSANVVVDPLPLGSSDPVEVGQSVDPFEPALTGFVGHSAPTTGEPTSQATANTTTGTSGLEVASDTSVPRPFASSTEEQSPTATPAAGSMTNMTTSLEDTTAIGNVAEPKADAFSPSPASSINQPYLDKPWWFKPQDMSWARWQELGGPVPKAKIID